MLWTAFVLLLGCKTNEIAETIAETESPLPTPNPTIAPTPTPVVEQTEPERWVCVRKLEAPSFYTLLSKTEDGKPLYAFTNENGIVEYRVIGLIRTLTNGVITGERFAFFPADETGELAGTNPVDPDEERPGVCETLSALDLRLKKGYRLGIETGAVVSSSDYYVYGRIGNAEPSFYAADDREQMIPGSLPIPVPELTVSPYAPKEDPKKDGERHITVFIGSQSVVVFDAVNGDWETEHVFICSTGKDGKYTPRGEFSITAQYEYKAMSRLNGVMVYAQYSSRFRGHYLFHTVPAAGQYKNYFPNGKQQMLIAEYEKLGTDASHGCVRMLVGDCCWIYRNCRIGTRVTVTDDSGPEHPKKPALIYAEPYMDVNAEYGWDPTDPDPNNPYLKLEEYASAMIVPTNDPNKSKTPRPTNVATPRPTNTATPGPTFTPGTSETPLMDETEKE